jgi:hypothetical protein
MRSDRKHITAVLEEEKDVKDFIYGGKKAGSQPPSPLATRESSLSATPPSMKSGKISIRLPQNLAEKLSQVWYERGLAYAQGKLPGGQVREKQEIIAEALQEWLEKRGYLPEKNS